MSIDDRLREGLGRSMSAIDSDAEGHLGDARRRGRRRLVIRRATAVVAIAAAILVVVVAAPSLRELMRDQGRRPAAPPSLAPISGTYTTTIKTNDLAGSGGGAVGTWLLTLDGNGTLDLASLTNGDQGRSITQYQVTGGQFITTALTDTMCSGTGLYEWSRTGTTLTFTVLSDPCPLRVAIFSAHEWTST